MKRRWLLSFLIFNLSIQFSFQLFSTSAVAIGGGENAVGDPRVVAIIHWQENGIGEAGCSGALISPRIVMTSAHCLSRNPRDGKFPSSNTYLPKSGVLTKSDAPLWVVAPGKVIDLASDTPRAKAIAQFPSPLYRDSYCSKDFPKQCYGPIYDFGVIVLDKALSTKSYRIASVEEIRELVRTNAEVVGLGYGLTSHDEYLRKSVRDGIPRKISYKVRSDLIQVDLSRFSYYPELMLIQTTYKSGQFTCGGDSGMPSWFEKNGEWIYIGAAGAGMGPECSVAPDDPFWKDPFWSVNSGDHYDTAQAYPEEISAAMKFLEEQENRERLQSELKAKQDAEAKAAAEAKKKTITCVKGKITKKVKGINPKCPKGFKNK